MSIDTITSQVYTVVAVYRGGDVADITPANLIKCDVNSAPDGHSLVRFQAQHGVTNSILIDGTNGATGLIFLHYCLGAAPVVGSEIAMPPLREGNPLSLTASVSGGTPPPTYQWYRNSQPISLATGPSYFVSQLQAADAGVYSLVVSNCLGLSSNVVSRITVEIPLPIGFTASRVSGQFQFHVTGSLMHDVTVEGTTNFLNWIPLWTNRPPALLDYLDPLSASLPQRFYRAIPWP